MTNDSHPLETIGESSQHSTPCMEDMSAEVNFDCMGLQLSSDVKSKSNQNAIGDDDDHDGNEDSVLVSPSVEPNLDEEFGEEADDCDLVALPGTNGRNSPATEDAEDPWLKNILSKGAAKREPKSNARKSQKNRKDELLNIHSETQRMIRESRVHLPYHNPEKKSLSSVLEGIRQKRESFGIGSRRSSVFEVPRSSRLVRNANANPPGKNSERVSVARAPDLPEPLGEKLAACKKLDFEVDDDDEESQEYEDLMTRLKKKKEKEMMQSDPMIDLSSVAAEGISEEPVKTASLGPTQEELGDDNVMAQSVPNPEYEMAAVSDVQDESLAPGHPPKDDGDKKSKIRELLDRHVDPKRVPKLGRKPCGEDELIIEEEPKGVEKLFMRLEKELERKKKQTTSIELSTSSKLTVDGVESLQVKKVVYNMDEKTEIKKTSRDRLKEVLRSQMMESRQERLLERYRAYEALGRDRGASRLAEDYPALPDDEEEDDDDFGSSGSDSSHEVEPEEEEEEEDEEEAAVVRQEQANPFIDDEADVDDDDDDDDDDDNGCIVEGTDDDDDDEKVTKEVQLIDDDDDDTIQPIRRWTAKIIDDDEEEDGDADSTSMGSERKEVGAEHRRQSVNLFDEDAMSCQGPEQEIKVPQRPFGVVSSTLDDHLSNDVSLSSHVRQDRDIARLSSSSPTNHNHPSSSMTNDVSSSLTTLDNCKLNRSKGADAVEDLSQPMSHHSSNRMVSQDVTSSFPASVLYPDWLLADSVNNDVKATDVGRVVQGLCSTPQENNEELLMFCSGSFATQKDEPSFPNGVTSSGDGFKSRKRRRDEEDDLGLASNDDHNDDDDDDDDNKEDDDDDDLENKYQPMRKKGKINDEFVEKEAELSGSEDDDDDEEEGLGAEDEMEEEEGDADDVGTEEDLRKQVHRVHLKKLLDQDKRDIRLLQEHLLEDGDLHDDLGLGRLRRFRWNNLNVAGDDDGVAGEGSEDEGIKEGEDDAKWRMMRLEREKFLQKIQEKEKDEDSDRNNSQTPFSRQMKLKLVSSFVQDSTTPNQSKGIPKANSVTPLMKTPKVLSKSTGPKPVGSFLARSKETLAKFSDPSKAGGPTFNNSTATLVSRNSRNFVFAHLSPSKKESMRKDENMVSKGSTQPRKKPQARDETPIPQSRILKFLNE